MGWAAGLVGFPLLAAAAIAAGRSFRGPGRACGPGGWGVALVLVALVLGSATGLTYVTPVDATGVWIFRGISMLLAAAKGYGGCEVVAVPNAVTGRQGRIGCVPYAPIDTAEAIRGRGRRRSARIRAIRRPIVP